MVCAVEAIVCLWYCHGFCVIHSSLVGDGCGKEFVMVVAKGGHFPSHFLAQEHIIVIAV